MLQFLVMIVFFVTAAAVMGLLLHIRNYKKKPSECCNGGRCDYSTNQATSCYSGQVEYIDKRS